jgi:hypothetical protein
MFEVTRYEPPRIFVTDHRTGETYKFLIETDGVIKQDGAFADGDARRAAIKYLAQRPRANAVLGKT